MTVSRIVKINDNFYLYPPQEELKKLYEMGVTDVVVDMRGKMDKDIADKFFKLISIFCEPDGSMPEEVEKYFGIEHIEGLKGRVEKVRSRILIDLGYSKKRVVKGFKLKRNEDIDPNVLNGIFDMLKSLDLIIEEEEALSLTTFENPIEFQKMYSQAKDYIFNLLKENGWNEKNLQHSFGCLYVGLPLEEYKLSQL